MRASATPIRVISASRRDQRDAGVRAEASPSDTPAAIATTFLSAPPTRTPSTSSVV